MDVKQDINQIIAKTTGGNIAAVSIRAEDSIRDKLGISSLQFIIMVLELETRFGMPIVNSENISSIQTVGDLYALVLQKLNP